MALHVIVGAGPVGTATASTWSSAGHEVRGGHPQRGPARAPAERVAADAADADRLAELATGADALYNCANPPLPPLAATGRRRRRAAGAPPSTPARCWSR